MLSGGELAAAVVVDACIRLLPGALGDNESTAFESFADAQEVGSIGHSMHSLSVMSLYRLGYRAAITRQSSVGD